MVRLAILLVLALHFGAAQAAPTCEEKFVEYVTAGWTPDQVVAGLRRWFGYNFDIGPGGRDVLIVLRRSDGSVYHMQLVGTLPERK